MQDSNSNFIIEIITKHKRTAIKKFYRRLILFFPSPPLVLKYIFHISFFKKPFLLRNIILHYIKNIQKFVIF